METIGNQATRLTLQDQFGDYGGADNIEPDNADFQQQQQLEKLCISTRAAKDFQRDIVRGVESYIVTGSKQVEIGTTLSEDGRKYGVENTCTSGSTLSKAASNFARAHADMEKERGNLLKALGTRVAEPLRAMVMEASLEDAHHLVQRYDRMRQEAEAQVADVSRRQAEFKEGNAHPDMALKLEAAECRLQDLKSIVAMLGKEAAAAMAAVEAQQQRFTLQRLIDMVESERAYHQRVLQILDQLEGEMMSERRRIEPAPVPSAAPSMDSMPVLPSHEEVNSMPTSPVQNGSTDGSGYFLGEVSNSGWAEGVCKGKAGRFPLGSMNRRERVVASKAAQTLIKAEAPWSARRGNLSKKDHVLKTVKGILDKLTPENFGLRPVQVICYGITTCDILKGVVSLIFDKALLEPTFSPMYALLCSDLNAKLPPFHDEAGGKEIAFKRVLLNNCQEAFEGGEILREELRQISPGQELERRHTERLLRLRTLGKSASLENSGNRKWFPRRSFIT